MEINIDKKDYRIYFGIDALDYLNRVYEVFADEAGIETTNLNPVVGEGLNFLIMGLGQENPVAIANFIKAGTNTLLSKPSNRGIDEFIGKLYEEDKVSEFVSEIESFLLNNPLTKKKAKESGVKEKKTK